MSKHTPGPWGRVFGSDNLTGNHPADIIGPLGHPIGHAIRPDPAEGGDYVANAQLMCAAPDLLKALKWFADFAGEPCAPGEFGANLCQHRDCETVRMARSAIAKAEGK